MQLEASSGLALLGATAIALLWANLPFGESYFWPAWMVYEVLAALGA